MSSLLDRIKLAVRAGLQFNGTRDLYTVLGYNTSPVYEDFLARYGRQDIAARVVDAPIEATWNGTIKIKDDDGETGPFAKAFNDAQKKYSIFQYLERADRLCALGQYSVLYFGFQGTNLEVPLSGKKELIYLQPYGQSSARMLQFEQKPTDPRFGKPIKYTLSPQGSIINQTILRAFDVHYSRCLHICRSQLESELYGTPVLLKVYNLFDDLAKVVGGSAEAFWLIANRGMQADVDKDTDLTEDNAAALSDEIDEYQHNLRRVIRTKGVKLNVLGSESPNPKPTFDQLISLISGATAIPKRILLGSELGQLASLQDRANWAERVEERRTHFAEPRVLRPTLEIMIEHDVLPKPKGAVEIDWPEALRQTPLERAQTAANYGSAASKLTTSKQDVVTQSESRAILGLDPEVPSELKKLRKQNQKNQSATPSPSNTPGDAGPGDSGAPPIVSDPSGSTQQQQDQSTQKGVRRVAAVNE